MRIYDRVQVVDEIWKCDLVFKVTHQSRINNSCEVMRLLICLLSALILCENVKATGELTPTGRSLHVDDGNFPNRDHMKQEPFQHQQQVLHPLPGLYRPHTVSQNFSSTSCQPNDCV